MQNNQIMNYSDRFKKQIQSHSNLDPVYREISRVIKMHLWKRGKTEKRYW